jgi:hypothetical protein
MAALVFLCGALSLFIGTPALSDRVSGLTHALENLKVAPAPKTGLKVSYVPRDDGELQKGVPWPDPRFTDHNDGTVTDNLTGLVWMKNASDDGGIGFGSLSWEDACAACNTLKHGDYGLADSSVAGDWRLPNLRELQSLVDYGATFPALPANHPFAGARGYHFWSSTAHPTEANLANGVHFGDGSLGPLYKEYLNKVWCVRNGK